MGDPIFAGRQSSIVRKEAGEGTGEGGAEADAATLDLPPARIEVPLAGRKPAAPDQPADGSSYFVWVQDARLGNVRHSGQLELRATDGSPPALWMEKALRRLAPCWTSARP